MNQAKNNQPNSTDYVAFLAMDWADQEHAWSLQVAGQDNKETGKLKQQPEVLGPWLAQLRERFGNRPVAVALEQSRGALIHALLSYDFLVIYPLHPTTVAKFREAFKSSGAKSDPLDTDQILEILTKHLKQLKPLRPDTEETRLLARLVGPVAAPGFTGPGYPDVGADAPVPRRRLPGSHRSCDASLYLGSEPLPPGR